MRTRSFWLWSPLLWLVHIPHRSDEDSQGSPEGRSLCRVHIPHRSDEDIRAGNYDWLSAIVHIPHRSDEDKKMRKCILTPKMSSHSTQVRWGRFGCYPATLQVYKFTFHTGQMRTKKIFQSLPYLFSVHIPHRSDEDMVIIPSSSFSFLCSHSTQVRWGRVKLKMS